MFLIILSGQLRLGWVYLLVREPLQFPLFCHEINQSKLKRDLTFKRYICGIFVRHLKHEREQNSQDHTHFLTHTHTSATVIMASTFLLDKLFLKLSTPEGNMPNILVRASQQNLLNETLNWPPSKFNKQLWIFLL